MCCDKKLDGGRWLLEWETVASGSQALNGAELHGQPRRALREAKYLATHIGKFKFAHSLRQYISLYTLFQL